MHFDCLQIGDVHGMAGLVQLLIHAGLILTGDVNLKVTHIAQSALYTYWYSSENILLVLWCAITPKLPAPQVTQHQIQPELMAIRSANVVCAEGHWNSKHLCDLPQCAAASLTRDRQPL